MVHRYSPKTEMATPLLFDLDGFDLGRVIYDREAIYARLPQQHEFKQLHGVVYLDRDRGESIAFRDVRGDEWWCRGHIPGAPIFPGVLMLEAGAQLAAFTEKYCHEDFDGFLGYGGVDACKFRQAVRPPARIWLLCQRRKVSSRRITSYVQGVVDGVLVFEATITGLVVPL